MIGRDSILVPVELFQDGRPFGKCVCIGGLLLTG